MEINTGLYSITLLTSVWCQAMKKHFSPDNLFIWMSYKDYRKQDMYNGYNY